MARATGKATDKDHGLKRLGGGRWQTRDDRFTIEPQSGTWVVVDAERTDDLGLPLVRGPFGSLTAAKEAIASARVTGPVESPLVARIAGLRDRPPKPARPRGPGATATSIDGTPPPTPRRPARATSPGAPLPPAPPIEPRWLRDLEPADLRRAQRLMDALTATGARDAEGIARRDVVGKVPAAAAFAIERAIAALGPDASPADVARLLAGGGDAGLGVRWRLVDGDDRAIVLDVRERRP